MRTNEELRNVPHLMIAEVAEDGGHGRVIFGKLDGSVIWSSGAGWDHVSVAPFKRSYTPSWDDMCRLKDMFFYPDEAVIQFHPPESEYVNNVTNCLHLWRPQNVGLPLPPPVLVGMPKNLTRAELSAAVKDAFINPYRMYGGNK